MNTDGLIAAACGCLLVLGYTHLRPFQTIEPPTAGVATEASDTDDTETVSNLRRELAELKSSEEKRLKQKAWDDETQRIETNRRLRREREHRRLREEQLAEAKALEEQRLTKIKELEADRQRFLDATASGYAAGRTYAEPPSVSAPAAAPRRSYSAPTVVCVPKAPPRAAGGIPAGDTTKYRR